MKLGKKLKQFKEKEKESKVDINEAFITACKEGDEEFASILIKMGANVNIKDDKGNTPLIVASYNGHKEIVSMLIKNKANLNDKKNEGDTAIMEACKQKNIDIIAILIKNGAKLEIKYYSELSLLE